VSGGASTDRRTPSAPAIVAKCAKSDQNPKAAGSLLVHALLASALKGFSPTPESPEIAEAQTLLAALKS